MDTSTQKVILNIERKTLDTAQSYAWMRLWDLLLRDTSSFLVAEGENDDNSQKSNSVVP